ncbi:glycoside hydrolase [Microdochium bolleyi]|uniref:Mannosyl-oligosaccharide glucosidase n=1 Tax=Microdochium bolleyi TaxID=196109 RepID=A0A136J674_9PEZI|nr:glycoside hydrolase [Microdochium bolleyi]
MILRTNLAAVLSLACLAPSSVSAQDESILSAEYGRQSNQSLLWGPYRPNLYFGVRPRIPNSIMAALMWAKVDNYMEVQNGFRYTCEQNEEMAGYGWEEYDTRTGGIQTIHDTQNKIDITTSFVKIPGGAHGGSWAVRIKGEPRADAGDDLKTSMFFYVTSEPIGNVLEVVADSDRDGFSGDVTIKGKHAQLGNFKMVVTEGKGQHPTSNHPTSSERPLDKTIVNTLELPQEHLWQGKQVIFAQLKEGVDQIIADYGQDNAPPPWQTYMMRNRPGSGNIQIVQKVFEGAFEFDVLFSSGSASKEVTSDDLTTEIAKNSATFHEQYQDVFAPQTPFKDDKYRALGRSMLSNLAGGIGYFYGNHIVDRSYAPEYEEENEGFWEEAAEARARNRQTEDGPHELFTSIPSRPFFPRGFLWDEGFHLLPIAEWDMDLALEIVKSWYNLMDEDGWIAREQILGAEARSKVPAEFQVQYPHYANPPTIFLVLEDFLEKLAKTNGSMPVGQEKLSQESNLENAHLANPQLGAQYLQNIYPLLRRQFLWFKSTQFGDIKSYDREAYSTKEAYRWRGRTVPHILTSGLDDYPRAQTPHPGELHVDLMSWVGLMAKVLIKIAGVVGANEDVYEYSKALNGIQHNLKDLHWSEKDGAYCDATIDDYEEHALVCHKGYVSLFPFALGLLKPDDPTLGKTIEMLSDPDELWSPHGIRSLSKKDEFYETAENYWRSPVWININYLVLQQLLSVAQQDGPFQAKAKETYINLRKNLVETIYNSWKETGFAWEQYNPDTGKGQRTQHFTGWTSLVVKMMAMPDLEKQVASHERDEL